MGRDLEKKRASDKKYREKHKNKIAKSTKIYQAKHKKELAETARKWQKAHPEKKAESARKYRESKLTHIIYCIELPDCRMYVGSTNYLDQRLINHRNCLTNHSDRLLYKSIAETGGWDKVKVHVLMKDIPCKDLRLKLEQHFIDMIPLNLSLNIKGSINKNPATNDGGLNQK